MLNDEICKLRDKLNKSIEQGDDYAITYKLSVELDELIAKYYIKTREYDLADFHLDECLNILPDYYPAKILQKASIKVFVGFIIIS